MNSPDNAFSVSNGKTELEEIFKPVAEELISVQKRYSSVIKSQANEWAAVNGDKTIPESMEQLFRRISSPRGKWIRSGLVLLSVKSAGGDPSGAVDVGVAVEMIHNATLLHDDVIDQAPVRRGQPTLSQTDGNTVAVLSGDLLFSLGLNLLAKPEESSCLEEIISAVAKVCHGEIAQERYAGNCALTEDQYLEIISMKTASLFSACAKCGGVLAKVQHGALQSLATYGHAFGMAFQIIDDLMDFLLEEEEMGKKPGADMAQGRNTLALIHYLTHSTEENAHDRSLNEWAETLRNSGSIDYACAAARNFGEEAINSVSVFSRNDPDAAKSLVDLVRFVLERTC